MVRAFQAGVSFRYGAIRALRNLSAVFLTAGAATAEPLTIAALGDSLTAGYGLNTDEGFVPVLQDWLTDAGADVRMINAGVSGDTTAGGLSRVDWTLTDDVDAMIVALGGNDYLRGLDPAVSRANLDGILSAAAARDVDVLLVGITAGMNYGPDYKQDFDKMYTELAATYDVPLYPTFFAGLQAVAGMQDGIQTFMQPDGIHPNAKGVQVIVADIGPVVLDLAMQ